MNDLEIAYVYSDDNQAEDVGNVDDHSDFRSDSLEEAERVCLQSLQGRRHQRTSKKTSKKKKKKKKVEKKKALKQVATAKSITLDVEPWDNEVDLNEVERL